MTHLVSWRDTRPGALARPVVLVPLLFATFWPVWSWYVARMSDGSDDPLGLIALVAAAACLPRRGWSDPLPRHALLGAVVVLGLYCASFSFVPFLLRSALAIATLAWVLPRDRLRPALPLVALLLLSLPVIATLQFYLGFPLRAITTWCTAQLLGLGGYAVSAHGTTLHWAGEEILVDAPCSGIRMLWTAAFLSSLLGVIHRMRGRRFIRLCQCAGAAVFTANVVRTILLFFFETNLWPNPAWAHEVVGLTTFCAAAGSCVLAARLLRSRSKQDQANDEGEATPTQSASRPARLEVGTQRGALVALVLSIASVAAARPLYQAPGSRMMPMETAIAWPSSFEGAELIPTALLPAEEKFSASFPGACAAFTDGTQRLVVRHITQPTRKLHPAEDCLRAGGFAVKPRQAIRHPETGLWGSIEATKDQRAFIVREQVSSADGSRVWTDVSAWYWAALTHPGEGPWLAITVIEPVAAAAFR